MTIALLIPTRDRPTQCKRMLDSIINTTEKEIANIYLGTNGDGNYTHFKFPFNYPTVAMWNKLAEIAMENPDNKLFMLGADDTVFTTPCWDKALLDHYNALENKIHVYALRDSRDPDGTPHPIVTREYIEAMGYFLPPIFLHWFVDSWTVEIAKANGCFTHMRNYQLVHDKPSDKGNPDDTHNRIRQMGWHDRDCWVNERCQHFLELEKKRLKNAR